MDNLTRAIVDFHTALNQSILSQMQKDMDRYKTWAETKCLSGEYSSMNAYQTYIREQQEYARQEQIGLYGYELNGWTC